MPSLTDSAIKHAIKRVERSRKQETLSDGEGRGTGRLTLILKPMPTRVAGRQDLIVARKLTGAREKLREMLALIDELQS